MSSVRLSEDHKPLSTEVFLDTSIHVSYLKHGGFVRRIEEVLKLFEWKGTSTYTKLEYGQVVLSQAEYFLRKLDKLGTLDELMSFIANVLRTSSHGQKFVWGFNLLTRHYGSDPYDATRRARFYLKSLMRLGPAFVDATVDKPLQDGTACFIAKQGVTKKQDGSLTWKTPDCKPSRKRCKVDEFFEGHRSVFEQIKREIDALDLTRKSKQLEGFSEIIDEALRDPKCLLKYRNGCRRLADAIIAVDGRAYGSMFSQNVDESEVLCQTLGQVFYYLPPNEERGVEVFGHEEPEGDD